MVVAGGGREEILFQFQYKCKTNISMINLFRYLLRLLILDFQPWFSAAVFLFNGSGLVWFGYTIVSYLHHPKQITIRMD